MNSKSLALNSHMDNVENQYIICLCTNYYCCINIGSDVGPPALVNITKLVAYILANPIIGTPLPISTFSQTCNGAKPHMSVVDTFTVITNHLKC